MSTEDKKEIRDERVEKDSKQRGLSAAMVDKENAKETRMMVIGTRQSFNGIKIQCQSEKEFETNLTVVSAELSKSEKSTLSRKKQATTTWYGSI